MKKKHDHACRTYFVVWFDIDSQKNCLAIREKRKPSPEELGIYNKSEVEQALKAMGLQPVWDRHHFIIGFNDDYRVDVNEMIRKTLTGLFGKEQDIKKLQAEFGVKTVLEIVPEISTGSEEPGQILSLDADIIEFLYKSNTQMDLDYYIL